METGAITSYIDVAQLVLYAFWIFFFGLILYLRREDKREGYPLDSDRSKHVRVVGYPAPPEPKVYHLLHGEPHVKDDGGPDRREVRAEPVAPFPGAPLRPTGNPMLDGVGPAAYAERSDTPDLTLDGEPKIVPLRVATDFSVEARDPDPRGMSVVGADGAVAGTVTDVWVDRSEPMIRYLEVAVSAPEGSRSVMLPIGLARFAVGERRVHVKSILADQFAYAPGIAHPDRITLLEEDRICAYFASGHMYATPSRSEPFL